MNQILPTPVPQTRLTELIIIIDRKARLRSQGRCHPRLLILTCWVFPYSSHVEDVFHEAYGLVDDYEARSGFQGGIHRPVETISRTTIIGVTSILYDSANVECLSPDTLAGRTQELVTSTSYS